MRNLNLLVSEIPSNYSPCLILFSVSEAPKLLKSSDITLPTKVRLVKAMIFPVVMYGCESWTVKKAEC